MSDTRERSDGKTIVTTPHDDKWDKVEVYEGSKREEVVWFNKETEKAHKDDSSLGGIILRNQVGDVTKDPRHGT